MLTLSLYVRHLNNLKVILEKAASWQKATGFKDEAICNAHLGIDQFPLKKQVQMMCDFAKNSGGHFYGIDAPIFENNEQTLAELQARIDSTITFLRSLSEKGIALDLDKKLVALPWLPGKALTAKYYVEEYALPQFYFHYTTAYSILRNFGLTLGKGDFLGVIPLQTLA
jgi:uncharacterized protein